LPAEKPKRKLAAILSANAEGYSRLMGEDEAGTLQTLKAHRQAIRSLIEKYHGRVVDSPGSSLLAEFASIVDALECAVEVQKELKGRNDELPKERRMPFRIGIHLGDVIEEEGKIYGEGVNVAALLDSLADAGGICVSRGAHDQVKNKLDVGYQDLGQHGVENISESVRVYRVVLEPDPKWKMIGKIWSRMKRWQKVALAIGIALLQVGGVVVKRYFDRPPSPPAATASVQKAPLPLPDKPSIAVLPFENMTGDPKQEYFTDGFTEQIITSLSKIPALFIISRNSTFTYKGKPVKVQQVSEELGVRYVLEGSVQKFSRRIRINVQLIDAISGQHVWAESYDRDLKDIFSLQDEVILKITSAMSVNLTAGEQARAWAEGTKSLKAYLKLMLGREYLLKGNRESIALARRMAEETIALDPQYAEAYAFLGATHMNDVWNGWTNRPKDSIAKAVELTQKALAMNDSLADARSRLGVLYSWSGRYDEGIAEAERGVELDPNSGQANFYLAMALRYAGKSKEAIPVIRKALRLEPMPPDIYVQNLALVYFQTGDCKEAIVACEKGLKRQPDHLSSHVIAATVYGSCGKEKEARKEATEVLRINPKFTVESFTRNLPYKNPFDRDRTVQGLRKAGLP
jgi:adenylate cyclase